MGEVSFFFPPWDQHPPPKQQFSSANESEKKKYLITTSIHCRAHLLTLIGQGREKVLDYEDVLGKLRVKDNSRNE